MSENAYQPYRPQAQNAITPVVKNIIIINVIFFVGKLFLNVDMDGIFDLHFPTAPNFRVWQPITYMFMHADDPMHIVFNMFALWMFGTKLESFWGHKRFLIYYFVTGIGAAVIHYTVFYFTTMQPLYHELSMQAVPGTWEFDLTWNNFLNNGTVVLGASGAVFGILLAFGMLFPNTMLMFLFIPVPIKAKYVVIFYGLVELLSGIRNSSTDNVAHFAHLGGMLFGFILIKYWNKKLRNRFY